MQCIQVCDVKPEQPIDHFLEKKNGDQLFFTKEVGGLLGIDITDLNRSIIWAMAVFIALCGVWFSKWKWWKVTGITQYFPNENLTF